LVRGPSRQTLFPLQRMSSSRLSPARRLLAASLASFGLALALPARAHAQTVRVMPLGDSITESQTGFASYRYWLWHQLQDFGFCVDFVGSQSGVNGTPKFPDFDQDHEGHTGWRTDQVLAQVGGWATSACRRRCSSSTPTASASRWPRRTS